ncbi:hypothetical protein U1E44_12940 [Arenibacter sp. GZD96]|nr:hypothetical protein [Arenibacter sp. GZD-96]
MVQLIVYPSFGYYDPKNLNKWHTIYTKQISYVVVPLMLGQLTLGVIHVFRSPSMYTLANLLLILGVWFLTFRIFVPIHQKITGGFTSPELLQKLVTLNWMRTLLWTLIFLGTLLAGSNILY